ncbi:MAG: DinB family protein, partial [Planctomycetota bacterium]
VAWQLGHLIASECQLIEIIRPGGAPELPEGFAERHGRDPEACADDDASHFPTKAEYLELYAKVREAGNAAVGSLTEADLDKPNPVEGFAKQFPTIGSVCLLNAMHPTMHVGQWVPVRREAGKPVVI